MGTRHDQPAPSPPGAAAFTAASLAVALEAELVGPGDIALRRLNTIEAAGPEDLTFIRSPRYAARWAGSGAGACLVSRGIELPAVQRRAAVLVVPSADLALIRAIPLFRPPAEAPRPGVHPTAVVDPSARVAPTASIGPGCVLAAGAVVEDRAILRAGVTLGRDARVGEGSELEPGVVVHDQCLVGRHCVIHSNAVIGADGFGFIPRPDGRGVVKIPHAGNVEIGDEVEIGACTCIDRGKFGPTTIGAGTKIDNHVQIAHNVRIGRACLIAGCTGIAGSVVVEDGVMIAGHCGIADNLRVGRGARVGAFAALMHDVPPGITVIGVPAVPHKQFFRERATLTRLAGDRAARRPASSSDASPAEPSL